MDVKFKFTRHNLFGERIHIEVLGQIFSETFEPDKDSAQLVGTYEFEREKARLFGMKLQEIGLQIQRQSELGKTQDILTPFGEVHCF